MAYANTYRVSEVKNEIELLRKDTTEKKVQFKQAYKQKRFMRVPGLQVVTGAGAITIKDGVAILTGTAYGATLAAPGLEDDGKILTVVAGDAAAFTLTQTTPGFNGGGAASDVATYAAAIGNLVTLVAFGGVWYVTANTNVTIA